MADLAVLIRQLQETAASLQATATSLQTDVDTLQTDVTGLQTDVTTLEGTVKTALSFAANWSNFGGTLEDASYSKVGRLVVLQGLVTKTGTPASSDVIATLPAGYRPTENLIFPTATGGTTSFGAVRVESGGNIVWLAGNTTETDFTSLSGIAFMAA